MNPFGWLFRHTLNSVPFGIAMMVGIGIYIAIGSGWVGLREWLEMDELLFFNWWPLKLLTVLLVANLVTVTVIRIPLTVPRYGVWMIHLGIISLVMSLSAYYFAKQEGLVPLTMGQPAKHFYDRWERALYLRTEYGNGLAIALEGLPRYNAYDEPLGNASALKDFHGLLPQVMTVNMGSDQRSLVPLHESVGAKDPITFDVVGYYPYAEEERWRVDPEVKNVGLRLRMIGAPEGAGRWLVASQAAESVVVIGPAAVEHRHMPTSGDVDLATNAAKRMHKLSIRVGETREEVYVEPGDEIEVGETGYSVSVEGFTPQFTLSDQQSRADALTMLVTKKATPPAKDDKVFRRIVLSGRDSQTDFELNAEGAGPLGKRLTTLIDSDIHIEYTFSDPTKLLPTMQQSTVKYILFTSDDAPGITLLRVSSRGHSIVNKADAQVDLQVTAPPGMFASSGAEQEIARLNIQRNDNLAISNRVVPVPEEKRDRNNSMAGVGQMLRVRVKSGDWSEIIPVPFDIFPMENAWQSPKVRVPGAERDFQLMLGRVRRPLPMTVRLEKFEPIPYPGNDGPMGSGFMKDFRSTISLIDEETGHAQQMTASLNSPAFYTIRGPIPLLTPSQSWLLAQASWNPDNLNYTVLQVGNRPAVTMMTLACVLIFVGLLYAFYAKPLIVRKMKERAIHEAKSRKPQVPGSLASAMGREGS